MKLRNAASVWLLLILIATFALASCAGNANTRPTLAANSPLKAWIGMSLDELKQVYPDIKPDAEIADRYQRAAEEFGLSGNWTYSFTGGKLKWFIFNAYQNTVTQANFNSFLVASNEMIASYRQILGQPARLRTGILDFNDPSQKPHNGYMVEQASWTSSLGNVKVDYSFLGENKYYQLLVSVQVSG